MGDEAARTSLRAALRAHPEVHVATVMAALVAAVSIRAVGALVLLGLVPLVAATRVPSGRRRIARRLLALLPVIALASVCRAAWTTGLTPVVILGVTTSREALAIGGLVALRVITAVLWTSWLALAWTPSELELALRRLRLPSALVELVALTRRFAAQLRATLDAAWSAAALRGGFGSLRVSADTIGLLGGVVVVRALDRAERVSVALALRGHGALSEPRLTPADAPALEALAELPERR